MQLYEFVNKLRKTSLDLICIREFNGWPNFLSTGIIVEKIHSSMLKKINFNMLSDVCVLFVVESFFIILFSLRLFFHENFVRHLAV